MRLAIRSLGNKLARVQVRVRTLGFSFLFLSSLGLLTNSNDLDALFLMSGTWDYFLLMLFWRTLLDEVLEFAMVKDFSNPHIIIYSLPFLSERCKVGCSHSYKMFVKW